MAAEVVMASWDRPFQKLLGCLQMTKEEGGAKKPLGRLRRIVPISKGAPKNSHLSHLRSLIKFRLQLNAEILTQALKGRD